MLDDIAKFKGFLQSAFYSPKNIQYGLSIVRDYINYCIAAEGLDFPIHLFRIKQERSKSHHPVTELEYRALLSVFPTNDPISLQRRVMLMMLHDTGIRVGELLNLKMKDVEKRNIVIENEKNKRSRMVSWSTETDKVLRRYLHLRENLKTEEPYVFVSLFWIHKKTRKLTSRTVERFIRDGCKKAGVETVVRPHSFRHGFVHRKLDEGKPITTVAQMLGHSTTMNVLTYSQLSSKEIKEAWGVD